MNDSFTTNFDNDNINARIAFKKTEEPKQFNKKQEELFFNFTLVLKTQLRFRKLALKPLTKTKMKMRTKTARARLLPLLESEADFSCVGVVALALC